MPIQAEKIRNDFEVLRNKIIYFDNACMALKPKQVVDKINEYYNKYPGCAGRSHHKIGKMLEHEIIIARKKIANFFNAKTENEIIFTRNTTESINLVANSFGLKKGDAVLISDKEHNSNLVPWLFLKKNEGIKLRTFEFGNLDDFERQMTNDVKLVSVVQTSNVDGTSQDIREMAKIAHKKGAKIIVDAAQSAPHKEIDVRKLDVDFMACSGHKMLGPTGIGILYGKLNELEKLSPFLVGGDTVKNTTYNSVEMEDIPARFEAGLQNYSGIVGFGAAVDYLKKIGLKNIENHEHALNKIITEGLGKKLELLGPYEPEKRGGIFSFNIKGIDPHEIAGILDHSANIMIRSGMHCVHSWFNAHKLKGSARASLYLYNTEEEANRFVEEVNKIIRMTK
jgi:cysteine desulfurase/selenocysteine lyase